MTYSFYHIYDLPWESCSLHLLDEHEQRRYAQAGLAFLRTRLTLKQALADHLQLPLSEIRLAYHPQGKPYLAEHPQLHFNLSHSADMIAIAIDAHPLGIDIEHMRPRRLAALARRIMSEQSYEAFIAGGERIEEFYSYWCACEALVKQAGNSIWNMRDIPFAIQGGCVQLEASHRHLHVELLRPAPHMMAAIATCCTCSETC